MPEKDFEQRVPREPGPQPDPMLSEGRASQTRTWGVSIVIAAAVLAVMYGITTHRADVKDEQRQTEIQQSTPNSTTPGQALPGGRTTADAPSTAAPKSSTRGPSQ